MSQFWWASASYSGKARFILQAGQRVSACIPKKVCTSQPTSSLDFAIAPILMQSLRFLEELQTARALSSAISSFTLNRLDDRSLNVIS
jgi:hypothetical protein